MQLSEPPEAREVIAQLCDECGGAPVDDTNVRWRKRHVVLAERDCPAKPRAEQMLKQLAANHPDCDPFRIIFYETENRERVHHVGARGLTKFLTDKAHLRLEYAGAIIIPKNAKMPKEWRTAIPGGPDREARLGLVRMVGSKILDEMGQEAHPN
jgi:hypothetical protein